MTNQIGQLLLSRTTRRVIQRPYDVPHCPPRWLTWSNLHRIYVYQFSAVGGVVWPMHQRVLAALRTPVHVMLPRRVGS